MVMTLILWYNKSMKMKRKDLPSLPLRKTLFWDVDPKKLDIDKSAQFIIGRVLDFGDLDEWKTIEKLYGLKKIRRAALEHPFESERSKSFWALILKLSPKSLSCTRKHLPKIPSAFLSR